MREVLRVPGLVEERAPVVGAALRLDHEHDAIGNLDRHAERARRLVRAILEVELDVPLRAQVDAEVGERRLERRHHPVLRETHRPSRRRGRRAPRPSARSRRGRARCACGRSGRPRPPRGARSSRGSAGTARRGRRAGYWNAAVELEVVRRAEPLRLAVHDLVLAEVERRCAPRSRRCARARAARASSRSSSFAMRGRRSRYGISSSPTLTELRLGLGDLLLFLADEVAEVALAGEPPELARRCGRRSRDAPIAERGVELRQLLVPLVDRRRGRRSPSARRNGGRPPRRARR